MAVPRSLVVLPVFRTRLAGDCAALADRLRTTPGFRDVEVRPGSTYVTATVHVSRLVTTDDAMREVISSGRTSETPDEPVLLNAAGGRSADFEVSDGHHRIAALLASGAEWIRADIDPAESDEPYEPPYYHFPELYG